MTHHTDAELLPCPFCGDHAETDFIPEHHSYAIECHSMGCAARVIKDTASDVIEAWNRRAPTAPVPQGWKLVPVESTEAMARAFRADDAPGYFCMTTLRCADFSERYVAMLAAAPQPPEAAPVQLPEPAAWVYSFTHSSATGKPDLRVESITTDRERAFSEGHSDQFALYTEQQVRELLANHNIQEQST